MGTQVARVPASLSTLPAAAGSCVVDKQWTLLLWLVMAFSKCPQTQILEGRAGISSSACCKTKLPQQKLRKTPPKTPQDRGQFYLPEGAYLELGEVSGFSSSLHSTPTDTHRLLELAGP